MYVEAVIAGEWTSQCAIFSPRSFRFKNKKVGLSSSSSSRVLPVEDCVIRHPRG